MNVITRSCCIAAAIFLGGCSTKEWQKLAASDETTLPRRAYLASLPVIAQDEHYCGPAALSTVLEHNSHDAPARAEVAAAVFSPEKSGTLQLSIVSAARRFGQLAYPLRPELRAVLVEVAAGHPVLVLQNLALPFWPIWHYSVVRGYDLDRGEITIHSGGELPETINLTPFENTWSRAERWAILVLPANAMPATVERIPYLQAISGLERAGQTAAAEAGYRSTLNRWPNDPAAAVGLANTLRARGALAESTAVLRDAVAAHPRHGAVLNNLADALAAAGELEEAERTASAGAEIDGPYQEACRRTLTAIRERNREKR